MGDDDPELLPVDGCDSGRVPLWSFPWPKIPDRIPPSTVVAVASNATIIATIINVTFPERFASIATISPEWYFAEFQRGRLKRLLVIRSDDTATIIQNLD